MSEADDLDRYENYKDFMEYERLGTGEWDDVELETLECTHFKKYSVVIRIADGSTVFRRMNTLASICKQTSLPRDCFAGMQFYLYRSIVPTEKNRIAYLSPDWYRMRKSGKKAYFIRREAFKARKMNYFIAERSMIGLKSLVRELSRRRVRMRDDYYFTDRECELRDDAENLCYRSIKRFLIEKLALHCPLIPKGALISHKNFRTSINATVEDHFRYVLQAVPPNLPEETLILHLSKARHNLIKRVKASVNSMFNGEGLLLRQDYRALVIMHLALCEIRFSMTWYDVK